MSVTALTRTPKCAYMGTSSDDMVGRGNDLLPDRSNIEMNEEIGREQEVIHRGQEAGSTKDPFGEKTLETSLVTPSSMHLSNHGQWREPKKLFGRRRDWKCQEGIRQSNAGEATGCRGCSRRYGIWRNGQDFHRPQPS